MLTRYLFLIVLIKAYVVGTHVKLPRLVEAIQMSTHNISFYTEVHKKKNMAVT